MLLISLPLVITRYTASQSPSYLYSNFYNNNLPCVRYCHFRAKDSFQRRWSGVVKPKGSSRSFRNYIRIYPWGISMLTLFGPIILCNLRSQIACSRNWATSSIVPSNALLAIARSYQPMLACSLVVGGMA